MTPPASSPPAGGLLLDATPVAFDILLRLTAGGIPATTPIGAAGEVRGSQAGQPRRLPGSHGVPRRDIDGRVHISVTGETAGSAPEHGLALTRSPVHLPARRGTAGSCTRSTSPPGPAPSPPAGAPADPTRTAGFPVQSGLGADVPARVLPGAPCRPGHVRDLQFLDPDHVEPSRDAGTGLLRPVLAPVRSRGPQPAIACLTRLRRFEPRFARASRRCNRRSRSVPARSGAGSEQFSRSRAPRRPPRPGRRPSSARCPARESVRGSPRTRHASGPRGPASPGTT